MKRTELHCDEVLTPPANDTPFDPDTNDTLNVPVADVDTSAFSDAVSETVAKLLAPTEFVDTSSDFRNLDLPILHPTLFDDHQNETYEPTNAVIGSTLFCLPDRTPQLVVSSFYTFFAHTGVMRADRHIIHSTNQIPSHSHWSKVVATPHQLAQIIRLCYAQNVIITFVVHNESYNHPCNYATIGACVKRGCMDLYAEAQKVLSSMSSLDDVPPTYTVGTTLAMDMVRFVEGCGVTPEWTREIREQ